MADPQRPVPFCLALFLQAVSTRLTGAQLEECLREVTHFNGVIKTLPLDARQQHCAAAILSDPSMAEAYGFDLNQLRLEREEARRMVARGRLALEAIHRNESHYDFKQQLEELKDTVDRRVVQLQSKYDDLGNAIEYALAEAEEKLP